MAYSDQFLEQSSGIIMLEVPTFEGGKEIIKGILQDDPQIQMGNNWNPISEFTTALDPLQDLQQIVQTDSISNYVSASGMAWKGTAHIKVSCTFYLISFNKNSNIRKQASILSKLCTLQVDGNTSVKVHGGYKLNVLSGNKTLNNASYNDLQDITSVDTVPGTVSLYVNSASHTKIKGLLAQTIQIHPSTVSVANGQPLYYMINMSFTGYRSPITTDMESIYGV